MSDKKKPQGCYQDKDEEAFDYIARRRALGKWYLSLCRGCDARCNKGEGRMKLEVISYRNSRDECDLDGYVSPLCCLCKAEADKERARKQRIQEHQESLDRQRAISRISGGRG